MSGGHRKFFSEVRLKVLPKINILYFHTYIYMYKSFGFTPPVLFVPGSPCFVITVPLHVRRAPWDWLEQQCALICPKQGRTGGPLLLQSQGHYFALAIISWQEAIISGCFLTQMLTCCPATGCQYWQQQRHVTSAHSPVGCLFILEQKDPTYKCMSTYI